MNMLLKEGVMEALTLSDNRNIKRSPRSSDSGNRTSRLPALNPEEELMRSRKVTDEDLCVHQQFKKDVTFKFRSSNDLLFFIKSCGKQRDLFHGNKLHADILKTGFLTHDIYVGSALLSMYAKCGALSKAHQVFDELLFHDVVLWNALITGYAQHGYGDIALMCYKQMQDEGIFPDAVTYICLLKACASIGATETAREIHAEAYQKRLLKNNIILGTTLVNMYAKWGALEKAQEVFDDLAQRDVALWTALIGGYAQHGFGDKALECFAQMEKEGFIPNVVTFVCVLKACAHAGAVEKGEEIYAKVRKHPLLLNNVMLGTALVDMYAKCGALPKARKVFDELSTRDVTLWNALIAAYAEYKMSTEALACFGQMRDEGFCPNAVTYTCLFKACTDVEKGEEIHSEVSRQGLLEENIVVSTALVDMYARCGLVGKAQEVFDKLLARDVALWNALMAGYAQHGHANRALFCLEQMQKEGLSPNAVSFVCGLKACGCLGALEKGREIHLNVKRQGLLEGNITLGNALVDMYMKCGALSRAQDMFEELPLRNVASWNVLFSGYIQQGLCNEAVNGFEQMQNLGFLPDAVTFVCVLKACGSVGRIKMGEEVHAAVNRQGLLERHVVLGTALVDMYAKCGALLKAETLFDELPAHDAASWTALMVGYAQQGLNVKALRCFEQMQSEDFSPNAATFACMLKVYGSLNAIEKGEEMHTKIKRQGLLEDNLELQILLVDLYAKCGDLVKAREVFDKISAWDIMPWNMLIAGYVQHGLPNEALKCYRQLQDQGLSPDAVTYVCVLQACGCIGAAEEGEEIYAQIDSQGLLEKHTGIGTACVDMYAKRGKLVKAQKVFDKILVHDVISWTALIAGYANYGLGNEALNCYERMREEGLFPDAATFACILKACSSIGAMEKGKTIHREIAMHGLMSNHAVLGNALMDMYAKCGALAKAQEVFDEITQHSVVSWTGLMAGYAQLGEFRKVFNLFSMMIEECVEPNLVTFVVVLTACSHVGLVEEGQILFINMSTVYSILPSIEHHNCIVDLLSRAGHLDEAVGVIETVSSSNSALLFSALLGGCQNWMNVDIGGWAFNSAIQADQHLAAAYVGMSNTSAAASLQQEGFKKRKHSKYSTT